ncbi:DNA polymerase phi-domain-containing protein [Xylariaceae sp. FL1019]|nr:DNA polymerase phi-domain-containing protein [Xylariaceae sp. FL1019]
MSGKRKRGANKAGGADAAQPNQKRSKTDNRDNSSKNELKTFDLDKSSFPDELTRNDREREASIYELLGSHDSEEQIAAAEALITGLLAGSEVALKRHLEKRLFRGLVSSRKTSRPGFSLVLTEILLQLFGAPNLAKTKFPGLTFNKILNVLIDATKTGGNVPGQEQKDAYFGRLFGLRCFVGATILFNEEDRWSEVLNLLLEMAEDKSWMRSHCAWVIVDALPQMGQARAETTIQKFCDSGLAKTAEGIGLWLRARSQYPEIQIPSKPWTDPLSPAAMPEVARVLKDNIANDTGEDAAISKTKNSNWTAQLHFVWDLILEIFKEKAQKEKKHAKDQFKLFWTTVVDDGLFSKNATDGQKFRGFMLFQKYLQSFASLEKALVKELFSRNLMKCLVNQAAKEDRYLHRASLKSLQSLEKSVEVNSGLLIPVLKELLGKFGLYDFDQRTNSKTIESLLQFVTAADSKKVLKLLQEPILNLQSTTDEAEKLRQAYAEYVFKMTIQTKPSSSDDIGTDGKSALEVGIAELASCAYSTREDFVPELSAKTRDVFRQRLSSAFGRVTKQKSHTEYLCNAVVSVKPTAVAMNDELETACKTAVKAIKGLLKTHSKTDNDSPGASLGLALLYATTILQLYDGAPDALDILQDIQACSERMNSKDTGTSEILVEILKALVSRQSPMMRQISEQVFDLFAAQMTSKAIELLTEPLMVEENQRGFQALFENADDDDMAVDDASGSDTGSDNGDSEDDISEIGSDVEFVTLNGEDLSREGDESDQEGDDKEEEGNGGEEEPEDADLAALDDALAKVLNSHRLDQDEDAETSDDDSDMSDSEMMALDEKLVDVFKQRAKKSNQKNEKKDAKESVVNLKHRVLDLLNIYIKREASNALAFQILLPLLELVRTSTVKPLANKAINILSEFGKISKKTRSKETQIDPDAQFELLEKIHGEASKDASHAFAKAASTASLLVASGLWAADSEHVDRINAVYAKTFADCQKGKTKMQGAFFSDWINWGMAHVASAAP